MHLTANLLNARQKQKPTQNKSKQGCTDRMPTDVPAAAGAQESGRVKHGAAQDRPELGRGRVSRTHGHLDA